MSLDLVYLCPVTGRELTPFGSYIRDERRVCDCHNEPVAVDVRDISHTFPHRADGTVEEHITRGEA